MPFPARLVRPIDDRYPNLFRFPSASGQPGVRVSKIFVIKQTWRLLDSRSGQALPATNGTRKQIRRILIFDDHPDSLRLVFGRRANPQIDLSVPQRVSSWELVVVSILTMGALIGMFWPLI